MIIPARSKLLFIGDSITSAGRSEDGEPTPWAPATGLGGGYVGLVNALIESQSPELNIRIINRGINGNTVLDLQNRWEDDVLKLEPDWLSVMIGINDVWRQFDTPLRSQAQVAPERFEATLRKLIETTRPKIKGLALISPFVIDGNKSDPMRKTMDQYGEIVKNLSSDFQAIHVDPQRAFDRLVEHRHPSSIAWDRIHPAIPGHMLIAREFLKAVNYPLSLDR